MNTQGVYWNHPFCPSVCLFVHVSVCVQNTSFCQSTGGGIKSHEVTALVVPFLKWFTVEQGVCDI